MVAPRCASQRRQVLCQCHQVKLVKGKSQGIQPLVLASDEATQQVSAPDPPNFTSAGARLHGHAVGEDVGVSAGEGVSVGVGVGAGAGVGVGWGGGEGGDAGARMKASARAPARAWAGARVRVWLGLRARARACPSRAGVADLLPAPAQVSVSEAQPHRHVILVPFQVCSAHEQRSSNPAFPGLYSDGRTTSALLPVCREPAWPCRCR